MCDRSHEHTPVVGGAKIQGRWTPVSAFAGGYTMKCAKEVVLGAEQYLQKKRKPEVFVEGGELEEEQFMEEEELVGQEEMPRGHEKS